jgi:hypothetical protein
LREDKEFKEQLVMSDL